MREWVGRVGVKTLFIEPLLTKGRMAPSVVLLRDELLEREAFDTLLEANGAIRAVAAAQQHDPVAQCLGLPAPGASRRGRPVSSLRRTPSERTGLFHKEGKILTSEKSVIHGSRSRPPALWLSV